MLSYHNDKYFKIAYNPQSGKNIFYRQWVGAHGYINITEAPFVYSDSNAVFVSDASGNDTSGDGTQGNPFKTILKGCISCTVSKQYVAVLDSALYAETLRDIDNQYFSGLFCAAGVTPKLSLRTLDFIPTDANTVYVSKSGLDTNAGTEAEPKLTISDTSGAISAVTTSKQNIMILDSETYIEKGWEFAGNVKNLRAEEGQNPTITLIDNALYLNVAEEEATSSTTATNGYMDCCTLSDGKIFLTSAKGAGIAYRMLNEDYSIYKEYTGAVYISGTISNHAVTTINNDYIFTCYSSGIAGSNSMKYKVIDKDGAVIVTDTTLLTHSAYYEYFSCCTLTDGNVLIAYYEGDTGNGTYLVLDTTSWAITKIATLFNTGTANYIGCDCIEDLVYIVYNDGTNGKYVILDSVDWSEHKAETEFDSTGVVKLDCKLLENGALWISKFYNVSGVTANYGYEIIDPEDNSETISNTLISSTSDYRFAGAKVTNCRNGDIIVYYHMGTTTYWRTYKPGKYHLKISTDAIFNGITFNVTDKSYLSKYILGNSAKIDLSWCTFDEIESSTTNQESWCIFSNDEVNMDHCSLHDSQKGVYTETNNSVIEENKFYRINKDYAVHINGAAVSSGDILVKHNTFFNNYAGLKLESNNGANEIVKNNIFHDNDVYDINADNTINLSYSTYTGALNNVIIGASVIKSNPLFINEGALNKDDTNLKLKLRILGYPTDSPAYLLADETSPDRDAGCWDVATIGPETKWNYITVEKPAAGIQVSYEFIGNIITRKKDGSIDTDYDDLMELIEINFEGIRNTEWDDIMKVLLCRNNEVRLYPDPDTYPENYNIYKLIYNNFQASVKQYQLSKTGKQKFKIAMARAYE